MPGTNDRTRANRIAGSFKQNRDGTWLPYEITMAMTKHSRARVQRSKSVLAQSRSYRPWEHWLAASPPMLIYDFKYPLVKAGLS